MNLVGERVCLRSLGRGADNGDRAAFVTNILKREVVYANEFEMYYGLKCAPETLAQIDLADPLFFDIVIHDMSDGDMKAYDGSVGYIGLSERKDDVYEAEIYIYPKFRRRGYAEEAIGILLDRAFRGALREGSEGIAVREVTASVRVENEPSRALMEKIGFECDEKGILMPVVVSEYALDGMLRLVNYRMTRERFERLAARQEQ